MKTLFILSVGLLLHANPTTLMDEQSGFYKNASGIMLPFYKNITCKDEEVVNQLPVDAQCIIALERHRNGKARIEYKGQQGWVDVSKNPDHIILMSYDELRIPMSFACSQLGPYFFEARSTQEDLLVSVYEKPSIQSPLITTLANHESCLINLGCEWPWCRVDTGEKIGWILGINLSDRIQNLEGYCLSRERSHLTP